MSILNSILLQTVNVVDTLANDTVTAAQAVTPIIEEKLSVWDLCIQGGFIMIPLAVLLIISIYITVERFLGIGAAHKDASTFMKRIKDYITDGEIESAIKLCKNPHNNYSRLILTGISRFGRTLQYVFVAIVIVWHFA